MQVHVLVQRVEHEGYYLIRFVTHTENGAYYTIRRSAFETYRTGILQADGTWTNEASTGNVRSWKGSFESTWRVPQWNGSKIVQMERSIDSSAHLFIAKFPSDLGIDSGNYGALDWNIKFPYSVPKLTWERESMQQFGITRLNLINDKPVNFMAATCKGIMADITAVDRFKRKFSDHVFWFSNEDEGVSASWKIVSGSQVQSMRSDNFLLADIEVNTLVSGSKQIRISAFEDGRKYSRVFTEF
jgi:hypothetical protein